MLQNSLTDQAPRLINDNLLLTDAALLIPAARPFEIYCDERLAGTPFVCTREPHEDEPHVSHDATGRAMALWPLEGFGLVRSAF